LITNVKPTAIATIALPQLISILSLPLVVTVNGDLLPVGFVELPVAVAEATVVTVPFDQYAVVVVLPVAGPAETCEALVSVVARGVREELVRVEEIGPLQVPLWHVFVAHWLSNRHVAWKEPHFGTSIELTA
jgi:hypothetical protein